MPLKVLRPGGVGNQDTLSLGAGASKTAAVDPGDPVSHDDNSSYVQGEQGAATSFQMTGIPAGIAVVQSFDIGLRSAIFEAANSTTAAHRRGSSNASATCTITEGESGGSYFTEVNSGVREGGGSFVPSDFVELDDEFQLIVTHGGNAVVTLPRTTSVWGELTFSGLGGFALFVAQCLPQLWACASHGVTLEDLRRFFSTRDLRPAFRSEWLRLRNAFQVRPSFVDLARGPSVTF